MNPTLSIRIATEQDAQSLLTIYSSYVQDTAITFEYDIPSLEEFKNRIKLTLQRYPYLVILKDGEICGYAYASTFKPRAAYDRAVETTIYLAPHCKGGGLGRQLYMALEAVLKHQNIINLNACITAAAPPYVDNTSELFHAKLGYTKVAHFTKCGYKFNAWYDVIWMEKFIAEHVAHPAPFIALSDIDASTINAILKASV